jgi:CRP-like cAMP-binding protein
MLHKQNHFLELLPKAIFSRMADHLGPADMLQGQVVAEAHQPIQHVYFPHDCIVSYVVEMGDGNMIETAMVGRDGVVGAIQVLDEKVSPNKIIVQVPGKASFIDADKMRALIAGSTQLRVLLAKHEQFFMSQVQQSVGCAATHMVEARMCRWLLQMNDLAGGDLPLTQEFLAQMMGVRRTSVSLVAKSLQDRGLITYSRGRLRIVDVGKVQAVSCECYEAVKVQYRKILEKEPPGTSRAVAHSPSGNGGQNGPDAHRTP